MSAKIFVKPWGYDINIQNAKHNLIEMLYLYPYPQQTILLQKHQYRSEIWNVIHRRGLLLLDKTAHGNSASCIVFYSKTNIAYAIQSIMPSNVASARNTIWTNIIRV